MGSEGENGGTTGCLTEISSQVAPPSYLDRDAIESAIKFILGNWPNAAPMTAAQREAWVDILGVLHPGELRPALAARTDDKTYRPDPYTVLEIVQAQRKRIPDFTPNHDEPPADLTTAAEWLAYCRAVLRREKPSGPA